LIDLLKLNIPRFRRSKFGIRGLSQSPVRRIWVHCLIRCVIRPSSLNVLGGTWKRISLPSDIRDMSALEVSPFHEIALHKSTFTSLFCSQRQSAVGAVASGVGGPSATDYTKTRV